MGKKWMFLVRGPSNADLNDPDNTLDSILNGDALKVTVESYLIDAGFNPTEGGIGFGEWEVGFITDDADLMHRAYTSILDKFRKAFESKLLYCFCWPVRGP